MTCSCLDGRATKGFNLVNAVASHLKKKLFGLSPNRRTEFSGPTAAINGLFNGKTNIILR